MQRAAAVIGHDELVSGTADGDGAPVMQAVMIRAHQHQVDNKSLIYLHTNQGHTASAAADGGACQGLRGITQYFRATRVRLALLGVGYRAHS